MGLLQGSCRVLRRSSCRNPAGELLREDRSIPAGRWASAQDSCRVPAGFWPGFLPECRQIPASILPGSVKTMTTILNRYGINLCGMSTRGTEKLWSALLSFEHPGIDEVAGEYSGNLKRDLAKIYRIVKDKGSLGATASTR